MIFGIIGPSEEEIYPFVELMEAKAATSYAMLNFYEGTYNNVPVVTVFSGVCKVNAAIATQILISKFNVSHLIHIGVAGALKGDLSVGDIIIPDAIAYHDVLPEIITECHPWMKDEYFRPDRGMLTACLNVMNSKYSAKRWFSGKAITGEAFIHDDQRSKLVSKYDPYCVDMESAAVAHACYVNKIPFIVIRSISDNADDRGSEDFEKNVESSSLNTIEVVKDFIKHYTKRQTSI